jgi:hypothetical protein
VKQENSKLYQEIEFADHTESVQPSFVIHKMPEAQDNDIVENIIETGFYEKCRMINREIYKVYGYDTDQKHSEYVIIIFKTAFSFIYQKCECDQQEKVSGLKCTAGKKIKRL